MNYELLLYLGRLNVIIIRLMLFLLVVSAIFIFRKRKAPLGLVIAAMVVFSLAFTNSLLLPEIDLMYNDDLYYKSMGLAISDFGNYYLYHTEGSWGPFPKSLGFPFMLSLVYSSGILNPKVSSYANSFFYGLGLTLFLILLWNIFKTTPSEKETLKQKDKKNKTSRKELVFPALAFIMLILLWSNVLFKDLSSTGETHVFSVLTILTFIYFLISFFKRKFSFWNIAALASSALISAVSRPENIIVVAVMYVLFLIFIFVDKKKAWWLLGTAFFVTLLCIPNVLVIKSEYVETHYAEGGNFGLDKIKDNIIFFSNTVLSTQKETGVVMIISLIYSLSFCFWFLAIKFVPAFIKALKGIRTPLRDNKTGNQVIQVILALVFIAFTIVIFISYIDSNRAPRVYLTPIVLAYLVLGCLVMRIAGILFDAEPKKKALLWILVIVISLGALSSFITAARWERDTRIASNHRRDQLDMSERIYHYFNDIEEEFYLVTQYPEALFFLRNRVISIDAFLEHNEMLKNKSIYIWLDNLFNSHTFQRRKTEELYYWLGERARIMTVFRYTSGGYQSTLEKLLWD
ncbi:MAG TPA: hypothetical protein ENN46_04500 [Candidatus Woesearchaeota archaeon]|nr:hypothetical protein [Candidatus Woesearchaeota archaeon]